MQIMFTRVERSCKTYTPYAGDYGIWDVDDKQVIIVPFVINLISSFAINVAVQ